MVTIRWDIKIIDCLSMVEDVLKEFSCCDINIISMKVTSERTLIKPWCRRLQDISRVQSCLGQRTGIIHVIYLYEEIGELSAPEPERPRYFSGIICNSQNVYALIEKAVKTSNSKYTVLIRSGTGTSKELLVQAIRNSGRRCFYLFVPVNRSVLPESLIKSEFFGYERGASSGTDCKDKKGLFEMVDRDTLFLDEFGEMSLSLQAKLLYVLQDGGVRYVGGAQIIPVNVRIIVVANANLEETIEQRLLHTDLYYRINVFSLAIPPSCERPQDISLLIHHLMQKCTKEFRRWIISDKACFDALHHHAWPGNVRELGNTIIRLMLMAESDVIIREELGMVNLLAVGWGPTECPFKKQVLCAERQLIGQIVEDNVPSRHITKALDVSHTTVLNKVRGHQLKSVS